MKQPANKIATDQQILEAVKKFDRRKDAAASLGMAPKTLSNRLSLIKANGERKEAPITRPNLFSHEQNGPVNRYVVTCAMSNAPVDKGFLSSIETFLDYENAQLVVIPQDYQWQYHILGKKEADYDKSISEYLLSTDLRVNKHVNIMGSYPLHATLVNPLQGLQQAAKGKSCIFGHPTRSMQTVATAQDKLPLLHYTTGAITKPRYTRSKTGRKSSDLHKLSAIFVEADSKEFHIHELNYSKKGNGFQMLDKHYSPDGITIKSAAGLVTGDEHAAQCDQEIINATYLNSDSLVSILKPEYVIRHDVYDHDADSHHTRKSTVERFKRRLKGTNDVEAELKLTVDHIDRTTNGFKNIIVPANHNSHLDQWLNEYNPHSGDPINLPIFHYLNWVKFKNIRDGVYEDSFKSYCRDNLKCFDETIWPTRNEEFTIKGNVVNVHSDIGIAGAKGSATGLSVVGQKMIIAHSHSPRIFKDVTQVGACMMKAGYTKGYSPWMTTHASIYEDGESALIHLVNNRFRLP
jgi:hypothetical protein